MAVTPAALAEKLIGLATLWREGKIKEAEVRAEIGVAVTGALSRSWNPLAIGGLWFCFVTGVQLLYLGGSLSVFGIQAVYHEWTELVLAISAGLAVVMLGGNSEAFRAVMFVVRDFIEERTKAKREARERQGG